MRAKRHLLLVTFFVLSFAFSAFAWNVALGVAGAEVVIGGGTAASCQTNEAANLFADAVAAGGVIAFDCGPDPVTIFVNTNVTSQQVTVNGDGLVTLSGEELRQIFYVMGTGDLTLNDLVLFDGEAGQGGAIYIEPQATVTLNSSFVTSNHSSGDGGGIYNRGTLIVHDSTLGSNIANTNGGGIFNNGGTVTLHESYLISNQSQSGGGIYTVNGQVTLDRTAVRSSFISGQGGGIFVAGNTQITNSTFSNNRAQQGGALFTVANATILNATFNENRADQGGAIWREASSTTTVKNSILAGSLDTNGNIPSLNCDGPSLTSLGRNIISDNTCVPNPSSVGDLLDTDPQLGVWFGSPLRAYIPAASSPVLDYALDCPPVDQRGYPRPLGDGCDVGSIERGGVAYLPVFVK